ncbi:hypothetical protein CDAR_58771 [Caerostris darwini]|uniref:CCHC FOG-type domain-containing protein n=1 Tax=Caerostris darwini TaxID=1538125 RepID=A0AAV4S644_9ARAC|nr:hypothetical protein CDAR_58771 [Caerostris darwini]
MLRFFMCPFCCYWSNWKANLNRHVRGVHGDLPLSTPPLDRYCAKCDIQFALYENYQAHKKNYCSIRFVLEYIDSSSYPTPTQQLQQPQNQQHHPVALPGQPRSPGSNTTIVVISESESGFNMALNQTLYTAISTSASILVPCSYAAGGGGHSPAAGLRPVGNMITPKPSITIHHLPESNSDSQGGNVIPTYTVMSGTGVAELNSGIWRYWE